MVLMLADKSVDQTYPQYDHKATHRMKMIMMMRITTRMMKVKKIKTMKMVIKRMKGNGSCYW